MRCVHAGWVKAKIHDIISEKISEMYNLNTNVIFLYDKNEIILFSKT